MAGEVYAVISACCAVLLALVAYLFLRSLKAPCCRALLWSVVVLILGVCFSVLPLTSESPAKCYTVKFDKFRETHSYPLLALADTCSTIGLVNFFQQWWQGSTHGNSLHPLGDWAGRYFILAVIFNTVGLAGTLLMSCGEDYLAGVPLYGVWLISSFVTNLVLQKIVLLRAALVSSSGFPAMLGRVFKGEVIVGCIMFAVASLTMFGLAANNEDIHDGEGPDFLWHIMLFVLALAGILFFFLNFMFSVLSLRIMYRGLLDVLQEPQCLPAAFEQDSNMALTFTKTLAYMKFIARLNIIFLALSLSSTSVFYITFVHAMVRAFMNDYAPWVAGAVLVSWTFDSILNDFCVIFIGFGPTVAALKAIEAIHSNSDATVGGASIIGAAKLEGDEVGGAVVEASSQRVEGSHL